MTLCSVRRETRAASVIIDLDNIALAVGTGRTMVTAHNTVGGAPLRAL